jgi:hypothetical protein
VATRGRVLAQIQVGPRAAAGVLQPPEGTIPFGLLDPGYFSGDRSGDEFFDYVARSRSTDGPAGRVADPQVVWYMRLLVPQERYLDRILRDRDAGAPSIAWLKDVRRMARRFGTTVRIDDRISELTELARVLGTPIGAATESPGE